MRGKVCRRVVMLLAPAIPFLFLRVFAEGDSRPSSRSEAASPQPGPSYVGVGGCAAMACHGGTRPNERREYTTWIERDSHSRAFLVLYDDSALRMARRLGIDRPEQDGRCLSCHTTAAEPRGPKFSLEDGVSCEACHGPADRWLTPHSRPEWKLRPDHEKYDATGMVNTNDLSVRAAICAKCHVGEPGREVTHDLIAAGHPPLLFELDAYTANMPPHWREPADKDATSGAQAWAVGQATSLVKSLDLLAHRAQRVDWPELAEFECRACHHELSDKSWRRQIGFAGRRAGSPIWSNPHVLMVMRQIGATTNSPGFDEFLALRKLLEDPRTPGSEIAAATARTMPIAKQLANQVARERWDRDRLRRLLADLAADPPVESLDCSTASHTTMALGAVFDSLVRLNAQSGTGDAAWTVRLRRALDTLYDDVHIPSSFDGRKFVSDLRLFREAL